MIQKMETCSGKKKKKKEIYPYVIFKTESYVGWHTPVVLATKEGEMGGLIELRSLKPPRQLDRP